MPNDNIPPLEEELISKLEEAIRDGTITPPTNIETALEAQKVLLSIQIEKELQKENIKQRNKLINFFIWLIAIQSGLVFVAVFLCIFLMSRNLLSPYEYEWVFNVLRVCIVAISIEVLSLLGVVVFRFFGTKKSFPK